MYGHEDKQEIFQRLAENDNLGQAYLFFGEPQIGKFLFARTLAYFLEYGEFAILQKPLVDTIVVSSDEDTIGLKELSDVKKFISRKPFRSSKRFIIIRDAQKLTPHAASSLLKFVEEASSHTSFIFTANDPQVLLPPLASRLMKVHFSKLPTQRIQKILEDDFECSESKAQTIAQESFGRIGHAINILNVDDDEDDDDDEESILSFVNRKIKELYLEDKVGNAPAIARLLAREAKINRFNVNPRVQKKAIEFELKN